MVITREHWVTMYKRIDNHLAYCKAAGWSQTTTIPDRREVLTRVAHDLGDLRTLRPAAIIRWLGNEKWSPKTRATYHEHLSGYYRWEVETGGMTTNPMLRVPRSKVPPRRPRSVPDWVAGVVLTRASEPFLTAAKLAAYAGLRCFEIAKCRADDIDEDWIQVLGKGGRVDQIPTSPAIWSHVHGRAGLLVRPVRGLAYTPKTLSAAFADHCRHRLGVAVGLHDLRRHYGNSLRRNGVDLETIRLLMRHTSLVTTQKYLDVGDEERRLAIRALPVPATSPQQTAA